MIYQDENLNYTDAEQYDKRGESSVLESYALNLWQPFLKKKIAGLSSGKVVVDWGCGTCEYAQAAAAAKRIYAIDASEEMIKVCRQKLAKFNNAEIIHNSGFSGKIPDKAADLILTIGVWEYVDPHLLLKEVKRLSKIGAKTIVVFPNFYNALNLARSLGRMRKIALRPGFIKSLFEYDFTLIESASFGNVSFAPKRMQFLALPVWKFCDRLWSPFQKFLPVGINVYYLFERK